MAPLFRVFSALFSLSYVIAAPPNSYQNACRDLEAKFPALTFFSTDVSYAEDSINNWSQTCQRAPSCIFEPATAQDVSAGLAILRKANRPFALRSGGHMPVPGASGISDGVLVSLERLTTLKYTQGTSVLQMGSGNRWRTVYDLLAKSSLAVAGGRFGPIGVPGLLLGGGLSYFSSEFGWGASSVTNYEVVLADGTITNANSGTNSELFWALKGGSSNFAIVTRFDMKTFPLKEQWGGTALYGPEALNPIVEAYASWAVAQGGSSDSQGHADPSVTINATSGAVSVFSIYVHKGPDPNPASLRNFTKVPATFSDLRVAQGVNGLYNDTNPPQFDSNDLRQTFSSTGLKSSGASIRLINTTLFSSIAATPQLKAVKGLTLTNTMQTFTPGMLKAAKASGGDAFDLSDPNGNGINMALYGASWADAKDDAVVFGFLESTIDKLDAASKAVGLYYSFVWINDAAKFQVQDVFPKYGGGKSLPRLKEIAKKYDPNAVFQKLLPGGFKLG